MSFDTKNGFVCEPENSILNDFYKLLEKHAGTLSGSRLFDDLVAVYETLDFDLKEEKIDAKTVKAS